MALIAGQIPVSGYQTPNYAGAEQAAGAAGAQIPDMVSGFAGQVQDYMKQQKEQVKSVSVASRIASLLESKAPDLIPGIGELRMTLDNQEIPLSQRIAAAESLFSVMDTGFKVNEMINANKAMNIRMQQESQSGGSGGFNSNPSGALPLPQ